MKRYNATIPASVKAASEPKTYSAVLWTNERDRMGDQFDVESFDTANFERNPVVLRDHRHDQPIGRATRVWTEGETLRADFILASTEKARETAELIAEGVLSAVSIGFSVLGKTLELLEFSVVSIPAHQDALIIQRALPQTEEDGMSEQPQTAREGLKKVSSPPATKSEPRAYNLGAAMAAQAGLDGIDAGFEREISQELQRKTGRTEFQVPLAALMSTKAHETTTPGAGVELTDESQRAELYAEIGNAIRASMVTGAAGARVIVEPEETASVPVMTDGLTPAWQAKDADAADTSAVFDAKNVVPKYLGGSFVIKRSALQYSSHPQISEILQNDLRRAVAHELDRVALVGDATTNVLEPAGITHEISTSGNIDTVDSTLAFLRGVQEYDEARASEVRVITRQAVLDRWTQQPLGTGVDAPAHVLGSREFFGVPALTTKALTADANRAETIAGLFSELMIFMFGPSASVVMNPWGSEFLSGGVQGRILVDANVLIRAPGAFAWGLAPVVQTPAAQAAGGKK